MNAGAWIEKGGSGREFQLWRSEPVALVGIMELGSLREALRAGRAILQHEEFHMGLTPEGLWWDSDHMAR
jgi:hypothetical protein